MLGVVAAASYVRSPREDPGITTEVALVVTFLLGVLAYSEPVLGAGLGVATASILAFRTPIHRFVRNILTEQELHDLLLFAAGAAVVLPLMPDRSVGPFDVLNPFKVWRLVVLVMGISGVGYVALRLLGPRFGLPVAGLAGGFVSSAATIGSMGSLARKVPALVRPAVAGAVFSTVATILQMAVVLELGSRETLAKMVLPLTFAGAAAIVFGVATALGLRGSPSPSESMNPGRAFQVRTAVVFAGTVTVIMFTAAALQSWLGDAGLALSVGLAGFADAHAAAASAAALAAKGEVSPDVAAFAILVGLTTNAITKAVVAATTGRRRYALPVWGGLAAVVGAAWAGEAVRLAL